MSFEVMMDPASGRYGVSELNDLGMQAADVTTFSGRNAQLLAEHYAEMMNMLKSKQALHPPALPSPSGAQVEPSIIMITAKLGVDFEVELQGAFSREQQAWSQLLDANGFHHLVVAYGPWQDFERDGWLAYTRRRYQPTQPIHDDWRYPVSNFYEIYREEVRKLICTE